MRHNSFVGYTRTSTPRQELDGLGHEHQAARIRDAVLTGGGVLLGIGDDTASGHGAESFRRRHGLQDALRQARETGSCLVVDDLSRLGRDARLLADAGNTLPPIWCLRRGRVVSRKELTAGIEAAQQHVETIQQETQNALARQRRAGKTLGSPCLPVARRAGSIANGLRAETKVRGLAGILSANPAWQSLTRRELVEKLNSSGFLNCTSERHGDHTPWTVDSLRKPLRRARDQLRLDDEVHDEEFSLQRYRTESEVGAPGDVHDLAAGHKSEATARPEIPSACEAESSAKDAEREVWGDLLEAGVVPYEDMPPHWRACRDMFGAPSARGAGGKTPPSTTEAASAAAKSGETHADQRQPDDGVMIVNGWFFDQVDPRGPSRGAPDPVHWQAPEDSETDWGWIDQTAPEKRGDDDDHARRDAHVLDKGVPPPAEPPTRAVEHVPKLRHRHGPRRRPPHTAIQPLTSATAPSGRRQIPITLKSEIREMTRAPCFARAALARL